MSDRLYFFSRSRDVPPGKGTNETVNSPGDYVELANIPNWRQVLSNFHVAEFPYKNRTYRTIEHAFQAEKTALLDPEKALWFSQDSSHAIGQGDGALAQKNRKLVTLGSSEVSQWDHIKEGVMAAIALCKYRQCPDALRILKLTISAELWHCQVRKPAVRFSHLEDIRMDLCHMPRTQLLKSVLARIIYISGTAFKETVSHY